MDRNHLKHLEYRKRHKDGSEPWEREHGQGVLDAADEPIGYGGFVPDMTEHKRAEHALAEANQRLAAHLDNSPLAVIEFDPGFRIARWSEAAERLFGWTSAEVLGRTVAELRWVHEDDAEGTRRVMADMQTGRRPRNVHVNRNYRKDATVVHCEWYNSAIYDAQGGLTSILSQVLDISERQRAGEDLARARRAAEDRAAELEAVLQAVPAAVWISHDAECRNITGNRTACEWLRLPEGTEASLTAPDGERPQHFKVFQNGQELGGEELPVQRAACGFEVRDFEEEIVFADGTVRVAFGNATPLWDEEGRPRGAVAAFVDITERKRAEEALRQSEQRLAGIVGSAMDAIVSVDEQQRIRLFNASAERMFGLSAKEAEGRSLALLIPEPFRLAHANHIRQFAQTATTPRRMGALDTLRGLHTSGEEFPIEASISQIEVGGERIFTVILRDITERMNGEAALRQSRERLELALDAAHAGYWDWDLASGRAGCGTECYALWGVDQGLETLDEWMQVVHPDDRERVSRGWREAGASGADLNLEFRVEHPDRGTRWLMVVGRAVSDEAGRPVRMSGLSMDITERKLAEEALREADRRKDEFLATLAHELRNPLAPIRNAAEILKLKGSPDPTSRAARDMIERQLKHMTRLVEDLLDVSRISRGKVQLRKEGVELAAVLERAIETSRHHIQRAGHELTTVLPPEPIYLDADPVRLEQVFLNLLSNACKYTEKGGRIRLTAERAGPDVVVKVADTGIGILPEHLPRCFDMFAQVGAGQEHAQGGLGIGLSLARSLVEMHGGSIEARSEGSGKGTELVVRLPTLNRMPTLQPPTRGDSDDLKSTTARRVLVVDDNQDVVESLALLLRVTGYAVELARDGLEAVEAAARCRPDVVLLDIGMPKLDGYAACRRIREHPWGQDMVIVALTGRGQNEDRRRIKEAGFNGHLVKPVEPSDLLRCLAEPPSIRA